MKWVLGIFGVLVVVSCTKAPPQPSIAKHTQVRFLEASNYAGSGLKLELAVTYQHPLKSPFKFYADARCREPDGAYEIGDILKVTMGTNTLPNEAAKASFSWTEDLGEVVQKEQVCKVRIFALQRPFERPEDEEAAYDFMAQWCLKSVKKESSYGVDFVMVDAALCQ